LCLEYLGRYNEAVQSYYKAVIRSFSSNPTIHIRLVDLYQNTGQTVALEKILDEIDTYVIKQVVKEHGPKIYDDPDFDEHFATKTIRRVLEIRRLGEQKELNALVELILADRAGAYPDRYRDRRQHWQETEAAKALSQYPDKAVGLLKAKMKGNVEDKIIYYALALCGTDEAKSILEDEAKKVKNCWQEMALSYSLNLLGKTEVPFEADEGTFFPRLPTDVKLPKRLAEIDEDVAFEESLPKTVEVDLSTPDSTLKTFFTSVLIEQREAFYKCIADSLERDEIYEDLIQETQRHKLKYQLSQAIYVTDDTAKIQVSLTLGDKTGDVLFILRNTKSKWLVADIKESR